MNYADKVLSRLMDPGTLLLAMGAVAAYGSNLITRRVPEDKREKVNLYVKAAGCVLALAGAVLLLDLI